MNGQNINIDYSEYIVESVDSTIPDVFNKELASRMCYQSACGYDLHSFAITERSRHDRTATLVFRKKERKVL